jgi:flagellar hook-basal body complex protein FliE
MAINPSSAAAAYANALKTLTGPAAEAGAQSSPAGPSFGDMVKDIVGGAVKGGETAEVKAIEGVTNKADVVDVVTAITNAELTLQTVVAVRDKVIAAYQDIMKMPI